MALVIDHNPNHPPLDRCPVCGCEHLYRQKDFNKRLGVALVVVAVVLAYFTFGLSLLTIALVDWLLFPRIQEVGICYQCKATVRSDNKDVIGKLPVFELGLHDYYKNLARNNSSAYMK